MEAARTHTELAAIGLSQQYLVINGVFPAAEAAADPLAAAIVEREQAALAAMPVALTRLPTDRIALKPFNLVGLDALRHLLGDSAPVEADARAARGRARRRPASPRWSTRSPPTATAWSC